MLVSVGVAGLFAGIGFEIVQRYYGQYPFNGDSFSYYGWWLQTAQAIAEYGRGCVFDLAYNDPRDSLKTLVIGLMPMAVMTRIEGTILFAAFCYVPFAFMLAHVVRARTGLKYFALATTTVLGAMSLFVEPLSGFPSERPDLPAAFLAGAAMLALLASQRGERPGWFLWFAFFAGLATLSRISASMYVLVLCAPLCAAYLWRIFREHGAKCCGWIVAGMALVLTVLIGDFLARFLLPTLEHYQLVGYTRGSPIKDAWSTAWRFFEVGPGALFAVLLAPAVVWIAQSRLKGIDYWSVLETAWLLLAIPLLLVFVLRVKGDCTQMFYTVPGLALGIFTPWGLRRGQASRPRSLMTTAGLPILTLAIVTAIGWTNLNALVARSPSRWQVELRNFKQDLARAVVDADDWHRRTTNQDHIKFEVAFNYAAWFVVPAAQHDFSRNLTRTKSLEIRRAQWFEEYGILPKDVISEIFLNRVDREIDTYAVLVNPTAPEALDVLKDQYTIEVATLLRDHLRSPDTPWFKMSEVDGPYGKVEVYVNPHSSETAAFRSNLGERARQSLHDIQPRLTKGAPAWAALALLLEPARVPVSVLPPDGLRRQVWDFAIYPTPASVDLTDPDGISEVTPDDVHLAARSTHDFLLEVASVVVLPENPHDLRPQFLLSTRLNSQALDRLQELMVGDPTRWEPQSAITTPRGNFSVFVNRQYLR